MSLHGAFATATDVAKALETGSCTEEVALSSGEFSGDTVELECDVSLPLLDDQDSSCAIEVNEATVEDDGTLTVTLGIDIPFSQGDETEDPVETATIGLSSESNGRRNGPAYKDPEVLERVYEQYDTFVEMTDALNVDVTPETVRTYMVKHGIHTPESSGDDSQISHDSDETDSNGAGSAESGFEPNENGAKRNVTGTTDGADIDRDPKTKNGNDARSAPDGGEPLIVGGDLPDDLETEDLIEAVSGSRTVLDVQRRLGCDRERTIDILRQFDLLDLVMGRLSQHAAQEVSSDDVRSRLTKHASCG